LYIYVPFLINSSFTDHVSSSIICLVGMYVCTQLGLGASQGISTYFSSNCEEADADIAGRFLNSINLSPYNTRLFKYPAEAARPAKYVVLVASAATGPVPQENFPFLPEYVFEDAVFEIRLGDHAYAMRKTAEALQQASGQ
jgi:dipeptidyl-peptidase-3